MKHKQSRVDRIPKYEQTRKNYACKADQNREEETKLRGKQTRRHNAK